MNMPLSADVGASRTIGTDPAACVTRPRNPMYRHVIGESSG
jgi:hypothetical protein